MAARPADGRNPAKVKLNAETSKKQVAVGKVAAKEDWRKQRDKVAPKVEKTLAEARVLVKALILEAKLPQGESLLAELWNGKAAARLKEMEKLFGEETERRKKLIDNLRRLVKAATEEIKTIKEIPVDSKGPVFPPMTTTLGALFALMVVVVFWKKVMAAK